MLGLALGGCQLGGPIDVFHTATDGGQCVVSGVTQFGTAKYCYQITKNGCTTTECPIPSRQVNKDCNAFIDNIAVAYTIVVFPAGCQQ